jgi:hypothetical protein
MSAQPEPAEGDTPVDAAHSDMLPLPSTDAWHGVPEAGLITNDRFRKVVIQQELQQAFPHSIVIMQMMPNEDASRFYVLRAEGDWGHATFSGFDVYCLRPAELLERLQREIMRLADEFESNDVAEHGPDCLCGVHRAKN